MDKTKAAGIAIIQDRTPTRSRSRQAVKPVWDKYGPKYAALIKRIQDVK